MSADSELRFEIENKNEKVTIEVCIKELLEAGKNSIKIFVLFSFRSDKDLQSYLELNWSKGNPMNF